MCFPLRFGGLSQCGKSLMPLIGQGLKHKVDFLWATLYRIDKSSSSLIARNIVAQFPRITMLELCGYPSGHLCLGRDCLAHDILCKPPFLSPIHRSEVPEQTAVHTPPTCLLELWLRCSIGWLFLTPPFSPECLGQVSLHYRALKAQWS